MRTGSPTTRRRPSSPWWLTPCPGEDLTTPYLEDAQLWFGVYSELLDFKEKLLGRHQPCARHDLGRGA